ncbi:hypothetical protein Sango_1925400 [Sesamum angolense]|uniref:Retrotransposon protein, putative, Ty1-copia subclass n=1 Tax=Sesamum angolense TaxID=2727404 RepID=A0AAE2BN31_9LAMI|nr:hypothetical protein Sango_1925400 [Sesamum angolense]
MDTRHDELLLEESSEAPQSDAGASPAPTVSTDNVPILRRDRSKRILGMTQNSYVEKVLKRFKMEHSKRGFLSMRHRVKLSKKRPDIAYALSVTSKYQVCVVEAYWTAIKTILKYLRRTKDVFLVYGGEELILEGFSDASFQSDDDDEKSQSGFVFKLNSGVVVWKSSK